MTIQQCRYVLQIVRDGSFSMAAKRLYVAQSTLSTGVIDLERELDISIFDRSVRGAVLTEEGAEFMGYAQDIVELADRVLQRYRKKKMP